MGLNHAQEDYLATLPASWQAKIRDDVEKAPPFTTVQANRLRALLNPGAHYSPEPTEADLLAREAQRRRDEQEAATKRIARALLDCGICGVPREGHHTGPRQQHDFVPLDDRQIQKVLDR